MRRILLLTIVLGALLSCFGCAPETMVAKPVLYLYPEQKTEISVRLDFDGQLTATYPAYLGEWRVIATPDGRLINQSDGREYSYLYWEGIPREANYDWSRGFCVPGGQTADFLQQTLAQIGLIPREYNEFIVYWLPRMQNNAYNLICFQAQTYADQAVLQIDPKPDSLLRVFMAWKPLGESVEIEPQQFEPFVRSGFTAVEWGGTQIG